jgi:integral membrane protein
MIKLFRYVGIVEGITTLALFLVAMPLKYWFDMPGLVPPVGMLHGVAFVVYLIAMVVCLWGRGFTAWEWTRTTFAAFFPFGTFLNDPMLKRKQLADSALPA